MQPLFLEFFQVQGAWEQDDLFFQNFPELLFCLSPCQKVRAQGCVCGMDIHKINRGIGATLLNNKNDLLSRLCIYFGATKVEWFN